LALSLINNKLLGLLSKVVIFFNVFNITVASFSIPIKLILGWVKALVIKKLPFPDPISISKGL
jgi:hypothetical protein